MQDSGPPEYPIAMGTLFSWTFSSMVFVLPEVRIPMGLRSQMSLRVKRRERTYTFVITESRTAIAATPCPCKAVALVRAVMLIPI